MSPSSKQNSRNSTKNLLKKQSIRCHSISSYQKSQKIEIYKEEDQLFLKLAENINMNNEDDFQVKFIGF